MKSTSWVVALLLLGAGRAWAGGPVVDCPDPGNTVTVNTIEDGPCPTFGSGVPSCDITLRCAIVQANEISSGRATISFNITTGCLSGVCVLEVTSALPVIEQPTTLDGTSQEVQGENGATVGTIGGAGAMTVGVDPPVAIAAVDPPEIEITADPTTDVETGLVVAAPQVIIRGIAVWGFGGVESPATAFDVGSNLQLTGVPDPSASLVLEDSVIGSRASGFGDPRGAAGVPASVMNVHITSAAGATIRRSVISFGGIGIAIEGSVLNLVERSEISGNDQWGIALAGDTTTQVQVFENLIEGNGFAGFDAGALSSDASGGQHTLRANTIRANGDAGGGGGVALIASTPGVQLWGNNNTIERNVISGNAGAGVQVTVDADANRITRNSISGNGPTSGQIGIDLHTGVENVETGTAPFVTDNGGPDSRTDFPALTRANLVAAGATSQLELAGTAPGGARVEVFVADVASVGGAPGEGMTFIAGIDAAPDGTFSATITTPAGVSRNSILVATATAANETSEFSANTPVTSFADVSVSVVDSPDPVAVLDVLTYSVTVANAGGSDAPTQSVSVTPDGLTSPSLGARENGWTCAAGAPIVCTRAAPLAAGGSSDFTITFVAPFVATTLSSLFTVDSPQTDDPVPGNNAAMVDTAMTAQDNLQVAIVADPNPVNVDDAVTYTLTVTNPALAGTTARATAVELTLPLPAGTTGFATEPSGWSCTPDAPPAAGTVTCTAAEVLVGSTHTIAVTAVAPHLAGTYEVEVAALSDETAMFVASTDLIVGAVNDLALRVTDVPDPAPTGAAVTYTLIVQNRGPDAASGGSVTATLPAVGTFASTTPGECTFDMGANTVTCVLPALENGEQHQFVITMFAPDAPGNMMLTAVITPGPLDTDTNLINNVVEVVTVVSDKADLALSLTVPSQATTSAQFTTLLTIANLGVKDATDVALSYLLPAGAIFVSANAPGWACDASGSTVTCTRARLDSLQSSLITVVALAPPTAGQVTVMASVESEVPEESAANNSDTATIDVVSPQGTADVSVTLADAPDPVDLGGTVTYTMVATNAGPDPAGGVTVTQQITALVTFVSASGSGWTCGQADALVTCTMGSLASGASSTIVVTVTAPDQPATLNTTAAISSTAEDPTSANNIATTSTVVVGTADVAADLAGPATARGGTAIAYTATVSNAGPRAATGVQAVITVGAGATVGTVIAADLTCTTAGQVVTCTGESLAVASTTITVNATAPSAAGELTTMLAVTTTANDPASGNNADAVTTTITDPNACTVDADCGNATSGRICEGNLCTNGCRGSGGNGCPSGQMCSSTTTGPGSCVVVNPPDAGVTDAGTPDAGAPDARVVDASTPDAPVTTTPDASVDGSLEGSGCSCTTGRDGDLPLGGLLIAAFAFLAVRRRR